MVGEDPGHGHLDGELDPAAHRELQEELPEPELGEVTALLQGLCRRQRKPRGSVSLGHSSQTKSEEFSSLTAEVQHVSVEETLAVKLFNVQDGGAFQTAAQSLLEAAFIRNERLEHSPHHVELQGRAKSQHAGGRISTNNSSGTSTVVSASRWLVIKALNVTKKHKKNETVSFDSSILITADMHLFPLISTKTCCGSPGCAIFYQINI